MKQRKVISILLTAAMVVTMAAGCVKQEPAGKEAAAAVSEEASADTETDLVLEPVDIKEYGVAPKITDFVPEDADTSGTKEDGTPWKIAWSSLSNAEESLAHMTELMEGMSEEMGFELVTFDAQADPQKQTSDINNAISQGCDALIVAPIDASSQNSVMKRRRTQAWWC